MSSSSHSPPFQRAMSSQRPLPQASRNLGTSLRRQTTPEYPTSIHQRLLDLPDTAQTTRTTQRAGKDLMPPIPPTIYPASSEVGYSQSRSKTSIFEVARHAFEKCSKAVEWQVAQLEFKIKRARTIRYNMNCGDGMVHSYRVVNFLNGENPTTLDLPPLHNIYRIVSLTQEEREKYCKGYDIPVEAGWEGIAVAIGANLESYNGQSD
ncbi:hypothetical protein QCA50_010234 [Cerrena zonata]|uniref:Mug135-like C-terminal domain-containing protein n=1 Tax=Cerrena zonata TaxID=2478898 RepID=A0AAW0G8T4_9APHY